MPSEFGLAPLRREGAVIDTVTGRELIGEELAEHLRMEDRRYRIDARARTLCAAAGHRDPEVEVMLGEPVRHFTPRGVALSPASELYPLWYAYRDMAETLIDVESRMKSNKED